MEILAGSKTPILDPTASLVDVPSQPELTEWMRQDQPHAPRRLPRLTGVQVLATGSYVPPQVVTNADLAQYGYDADWIVQRTGILARRRAADDVAASDLGYEAAVRCLAAARTTIDDVDLIVLATMTPDSPIPSTACQMQRRLGGKAAAFDVGAACAGFLYALVTGMQFVKTGTARRVLVIGTEVMTRAVNPTDIEDVSALWRWRRRCACWAPAATNRDFCRTRWAPTAVGPTCCAFTAAVRASR